jgi:hypothetical protein
VLGNLASDSQLRPKITAALGYENVPDPNHFNVPFAQPKAIKILVDLLLDQYAHFNNNERDGLQVTVIFCLKNLAIRHEENKRTIGRLAIKLLLSKVLERAGNGSKDQLLVDVTLRCLYVLSFERLNCEIMVKEKVEKQLQSRQEKYGIICLHIQKNLNQNTH